MKTFLQPARYQTPAQGNTLKVHSGDFDTCIGSKRQKFVGFKSRSKNLKVLGQNHRKARVDFSSRV